MCQEPPAGSISLVKRNSSCRINCRFRAIRRENRSDSPSGESKGGTVMLVNASDGGRQRFAGRAQYVAVRI